MQSKLLMAFTRRTLNRALLAVGCLGLAAAPALAQTKNPDREAYFGETHVHTSWSLDAWLIGNRLTDPGDAYKYFKGEPIKHPLGYDVKIDTPLDWAGVTDHSEYVGVIKLANDPASPISKLPAAQPLKINPDKPAAEEVQRIFEYGVRVLMGGPPVKALMSPDVAGTVWKENVALAEKANQPGKFTAFCSYEWTAMPNNMNLHRNVFFKDCAKVPPLPFSALDSPHPADLWNWMDGQRKAGNDLLAISLNAHVSDGRMYPTEVDSKGRPIDAAYAESRMRNEPLIEIKQLKGTSETHPLLSPDDEFASFELMSFLLGDPQGRIPHIVGSFASGFEGRPRAAGSEGHQPVQIRFRRRVGLAQHRRSLPAGQLLRRAWRHRRDDRVAAVRRPQRRHGPAGTGHGRPDGRMGGGEHARLDIRGDAAQGDLCRYWPAHQIAAIRRMGIYGGHAGRQGLGEGWLRERCADGRRSAAGQG